MIIALLCSLLLLCPMLMISATSPMALGASILFLTLVFSCVISFFSLSWFPLLLFLIYVGGLLIMFAYFVALSPNQFHRFLFPAWSLPPILCTLFTALLLQPPLFSSSLAAPNIHQTLPSLFAPENFLTLNFAALTLFITLLAVVKIVALPSGPLRPFLQT